MPATEPDFRLRFNDAQLQSFRDRRQIGFVCECGESDCHRTVILSPEEYEALRPGRILHRSHLASERG